MAAVGLGPGGGPVVAVGLAVVGWLAGGAGVAAPAGTGVMAMSSTYSTTSGPPAGDAFFSGRQAGR